MTDERDHVTEPWPDERLLEGLLAEAHASVPYRLPGVVNRCARAMGLGSATTYLVDLQQQVLVPLDDQDAWLPVDDSSAGWAYRTVSVRVEEDQNELVVWVPLIDGAERLGVLGVRPGTMDAVRLRRCHLLAHALALVITSKRTYSDWFVSRTRTKNMHTHTEMLRAFLPPRSIGTTSVTSAGVLEPAYELGGDAFDHSLTRNILHAGILDSMGHNLASGLTTAVALACWRNARRSGADLPEMVGTVDQELARWLPEQFCTGVVCQLNTDTGVLRWCNCGHPAPLLIRDQRVVDKALERPPQPPMGLDSLLSTPGTARPVHEQTLEPGDRVLLYTDGVTEARRGSDEFGLGRFTDFIIRSATAGQRPAEILRLLMHDIRAHHHDELTDDATIVLIEWKPQTPFH
ncbi:serine/threonine-protein phosphatase [Streptomyces sp. OfavH-34-F]|uniref:PP2C family protein-serine/threonine phosphatase n=1 Tax=Streptomyces sp. OfavH-34-F TaxID=2917760 RepID=UPI001EF27AF1|nr:PP2C family protein-serine/threonine phosphatase [Streptomyces sp. OfavH-34-F]MCG7523583.1 serine/threonine-protein phosphatase [Streptomyces sp. OfavH-34-F]